MGWQVIKKNNTGLQFLYTKNIFLFQPFSVSQLLWLEMTLLSKKASHKIEKHS